MDMSTLANPMSTSFTKIEVCYQKAEQNLLVLLWNCEIGSEPQRSHWRIPDNVILSRNAAATTSQVCFAKIRGTRGKIFFLSFQPTSFQYRMEERHILEVYNKLFVLRKYSFTFNKSYGTVGRFKYQCLKKGNYGNGISRMLKNKIYYSYLLEN